MKQEDRKKTLLFNECVKNILIGDVYRTKYYIQEVIKDINH